MSIYAKVSFAAVSDLRSAVDQAMATENQFHGAISCLRELNQYVQNKAATLRDVVPSLENAQTKVQKKIAKIEACIARLNAKLNDLRSRLGAIEAKLAVTPPLLKRKDSEGNTYWVDNPAYTALCNQAEALESEISRVEEELAEQERQLRRAQGVLQATEAHQATVVRCIDSLEYMSSNCVKITADVEDVRDRSARQTARAYELLVKIEQVINEHLAIKVIFDDSIAYDKKSSVSAASIMGMAPEQPITRDEVQPQDNTNRKCFTDDNGKPYRMGDELIANNKFQINGYEYETDNQGRTIVASGTLKINELGQKNRNMKDSIAVVGKGYQLEIDDRGHLIGHQFGGSDKLENLVPQDWRINQRSFRNLEDSLAKYVQEDHEVVVSVIPFYGADTRRPAGIFYFYKIDGVANIALFPNVAEED